MPRTARASVGNYCYHVINRGNARAEVFHQEGDYRAFLALLGRAFERVPMRLLAYCVMPTHWHLVLWPYRDEDLSRLMRWLTLTHSQRWHAHRQTAGMGHLYQGRFKSLLVQTDDHLQTVCRSVEPGTRCFRSATGERCARSWWTVPKPGGGVVCGRPHMARASSRGWSVSGRSHVRPTG